MLTPDELAHMTDTLQEQLAALEDDIVRDIARRIVKTGCLTDTAQWQLRSLQRAGLLYDEILRRVAAAAGKTKAEIQRIFTQAGETSFQADAALYRAAGLPVRKTMSAAMQQVVFSGWQKTFGQIDNLTKTTALEAQNAFISALNRAERQVESGAFDAVTAIRHAVQQAAAGGTWVQYPSGHRDRLDVAVRRAVLTGVSQTTGDISLQNAREMGCDLMKIDAHAGARPSHALWQGKVVSLSRQPGYLSLEDIGYGTGPGFKGWNCAHDWFPYLGEISDRMYPPEKLREYEQRTVEYGGETMSYYDATQRQRAMERAVRADKRELAGLDEAMKAADEPAMKTGLQSDFTRVSARLKEHENRLRDFTRQTGLVRQREREQVLGFGRSQASKAVWENRKAVEKYSKYHYNKDGTIVVTDDWTTQAHPHVAPTYKPFAVVDTLSRKGKQRDRMYYDANGRQTKQVNNGPHGNPKKHPYGDHGEHAHDILWDEQGRATRIVRELTELERKENADIL